DRTCYAGPAARESRAAIPPAPVGWVPEEEESAVHRYLRLKSLVLLGALLAGFVAPLPLVATAQAQVSGTSRQSANRGHVNRPQHRPHTRPHHRPVARPHPHHRPR